MDNPRNKRAGDEECRLVAVEGVRRIEESEVLGSINTALASTRERVPTDRAL